MAQKFLRGIDISGNLTVDSHSAVDSTVFDIQGSQGQLFSITNSLSGDLFSVSDISGIPILNVNSSGLVTVDGNLNIGDSHKIQLGDSQDLQIYHDGSNSYIDETGTGGLYLKSSAIRLQSAGGENMIYGVADSGVYIYHNNVKKFETTSTGVTVTGGWVTSGVSVATANVEHTDNTKALFGTGNDLQIYHDGSNSYVENETGNLTIFNKQNGGDVIFATDNGSGGTTEYFRLDGSTEQNVVSKNMRFEDNIQAQFGAGTDLRIYHDGNNSYIKDTGTGTLNIQGSTQVLISGANGEIGVQYVENVGVGLRHNNVQKLATTSTGVDVTGSSSRFLVDSATASAIDIGYYSSVRTIRALETGGSNLRPLAILSQNFNVDSSGNATFAGKITAPKLSIQNQINTTSSNLEINYENGDGTTTNFKDFYIRDGKNAVILNIQGSSKNATFAGDITSVGLTVDYTGNRTGDAGILVTNDSSDWGIKVDKDGTTDYGILSQTDGDNAIVVRNAAGTTNIQLQGDGDATFAGEVTLNGTDGHINLDGNNAVIFDNSNNNNAYYIRNGGSNSATLQIGTGSPGSNIKLTLDGSGSATFAGNILIGSTATTDAKLNIVADGETTNFVKLKSTKGTGVTYGLKTNGTNSDVLAIMDITAGNRIAALGNNEVSFNIAGVQKLGINSSGNATFAGNVTLSSTAPILYLANTTSSTGKTWRFSSAANGNAYITQDGVIDAITLSHTSGNATFAGAVSLTGGALSISSDGSNAVTLTESGSGDFEINAADDIRLDAGGGDIALRDDGIEYGRLTNNNPGLKISSSVTNSSINLTPDGTGNVYAYTDSVIIAGGDDETTQLMFRTDQAADLGDDWIIKNPLDNVLEFLNNKSGSQVAQFWLTPNATATDSLATFAGDIAVNGGDFNLTKQNGSPVINMLRDSNNPSANTLLHHLNFKVDYDSSHQDWGSIEHRTTSSSAVRTELRFNVKSTSGNVQTALTLQGQASAVPNATFAGNIDVTGNIDVNGTEILIGGANSRLAENQLRFNAAGAAYIDHGTASQSIKFRLSSTGGSALDVTPLEITPSYLAITGNVNVPSGYVGRDSHNGVHFSTDNSIIYRVADTHRFRMDSDNFSPYGDSLYDLGTSSVRWRNIYADTLYGNGSNITGVTSTDSSKVAKTGDTMTGTLTIDGQGSDGDKLLVKGSARIALENANSTDSFYLANTGGNNASVLDLGGTLSLVEAGAATFTDNLTVEGTTVLTHGGTTNKTTFGHGNEINTETAAGGDATMYLNYRSGAVNIGNSALKVDNAGDSTIKGHLIPHADATYDLGTTSSKDFRTLFVRNIDVYNQRIYIDSSGTLARFYDHPTVGDGIQFLHLGTEILRLGNGSSTTAVFAGNIGLGGATSPNRLLHIDNTPNATKASAYFYTNAQHTGADTQAHVSIYSDHASSTGDVLYVRGDGTGNLLTLDKGGSDKLVVDDDGNATFAGSITTTGVLVNTTAGGEGLRVYTTDASSTPNVRFGRNGGEYIGFKVTDRDNGIVFRQDETTGNHEATFNLWSSASGNRAFIFKAADNAGANGATWLTIENADSTFAGDVQAAGIYIGSTNTSFDFYNNGTSYLNGATTVDAAFTQTGGAASTFSGNVSVGGNLTVTGTTTTVNQTNLDVSDNIIGLNRGATSNANDSGIIIERGSTGDNAAILFDESIDYYVFGLTTSTAAATGNIALSTFTGLKAGSSVFYGGLSTTGNFTVDGGQILTPSGVNLSLNPNTGVVAVGGVVQTTGAGTSTFAGNVQHTGLTMTTGTDIDQLYEAHLTLQLAAETWTDTGISGTNLATGTYAVQMYVSDFSVGGGHYYEHYSGMMSWYGSNTNSTKEDEIPLHRAGHAPNNGHMQLKTTRHGSGLLMLEIKSTLAYSAALNNSDGGKIIRFKFRRLI